MLVTVTTGQVQTPGDSAVPKDKELAGHDHKDSNSLGAGVQNSIAGEYSKPQMCTLGCAHNSHRASPIYRQR
jgi:hypothetical protein